MNANVAWLLLPDELRRPSRWSAHLRRRAVRQGVDLSRVTLGAGRPWPQIKNEAGSMSLGEVFLASGTRLWAHKGGELVIGDGSVLDAGVEIIAWTRVTVGRNCYLGWDVLVMDTDLHGAGDRPVVSRPVAIGNNVRIGARAMILKGVAIGDGAVIHPGSIVTHDVPPGVEVGPPPATAKNRVVEISKGK